MSKASTTPWGIYLRTMALGSSPDAREAKLLVKLNGGSPRACRIKLTEDLKQNRIDESTYDATLDCLEHVADMYSRGIYLKTIEIYSGDWKALPDGGHQRINHINEAH